MLEKLGEDAVYRILLRALRVLKDSKEGGETASDGKGKGKEVKREEDQSDVHSASTKLPSKNSPVDSAPIPSSSSHPTLDETILSNYPSLDSELLRFLAAAADGDARVALSSLELALSATKDGTTKVDREELKKGLRKAHLQYDRNGGEYARLRPKLTRMAFDRPRTKLIVFFVFLDHHYDTISALHKSVRGGDANAALYWLARMLEGGDDPLYVARRLIRMASEDIGLANPQLLTMSVSAYQATQLIGMPECDVSLPPSRVFATA